MFFHKREKSHTCLWFFLAFVTILFGFLVVAVYGLYRSAHLLNLSAQKSSAVFTGEEKTSSTLVSALLGMNGPKTYLLLFQNNTELRPGGGFIGSYAVVRIDRLRPEILKVEGIEILDKAADKTKLPLPPAPIKKYLGVDHWYVRDGNWSPDFTESAKQVLNLYKIENGLYANDINAVIGITPTLIERLMSRVGNVTVQGITFTPQNVTEKLEYEVEYGYAERGTSFAERKSILEPFMRALTLKVGSDLFLHSDQYVSLLQTLSEQKQIMIYSPDDTIQSQIVDFGISGTVVTSTGDYLLWVDANLGALKTDHAVKRTLDYSVVKDEQNGFVSSATMSYQHTGDFDWRTSRYRTYARVYVPAGSKLIGVSTHGRKDVTIPISSIDKGSDLGHDWFGVFVSIEPTETKRLKFDYILPGSIKKMIDDNSYKLIVQKQLGTVDSGLTLNIDFGKKLVGAMPSESKEKWGDEVYQIQTNLIEDRRFEVKF